MPCLELKLLLLVYAVVLRGVHPICPPKAPALMMNTKMVTMNCNETRKISKKVLMYRIHKYLCLNNNFQCSKVISYMKYVREDLNMLVPYQVLVCKDGYHMRKNSVCEECSTGYYGKDCQNKCQCTPQGTCNKTDGSCECQAGYSGTFCEKKCSDGFYGKNCKETCKCQNGGKCDIYNGSCDCLPPGWNGTYCEQPCITGSYGKYCQHKCVCTNSTVCDPVDGKCTSCPAGRYGQNCEFDCKAGYYGKDCNRKCQCTNNGKCDRKDGSCSCDKGYTGKYCEKTCSPGFYGNNCMHKCKCQNGGKCDVIDGSCDCIQDGWYGKFCEKPCLPGRYGKDCRYICRCHTKQSSSNHCNSTTGQCPCLPGYTSRRCFDACAVGQYGKDCVHKCDCVHNYSFHNRCDVATGQCPCLPGYTNRNCSQLCPNGTHGIGCKECQCSLDHMTGGCHPVHGKCYCSPGFTGYNCNKTCSVGKYGANCSSTCNCKECDPIDGCTQQVTINLEKQEGNTSMQSIAVGTSVAIFMLIVALGISMYMCKRRKNQFDNHSKTHFDARSQVCKFQKTNGIYDELQNHNSGSSDMIYQDLQRDKNSPPKVNQDLYDRHGNKRKVSRKEEFLNATYCDPSGPNKITLSSQATRDLQEPQEYESPAFIVETAHLGKYNTLQEEHREDTEYYNVSNLTEESLYENYAVIKENKTTAY